MYAIWQFLERLADLLLPPLCDGKGPGVAVNYDPSTDYVARAAPFRLANGTLIDILDPDLDALTPSVVARSLAHLNRFGGHTPYPYSVAAHSILVSHLMAGTGLEYEGLMHDFPEALGLVDLPSPVKRLLPEYKILEHRVRALVAPHFCLAVECPPEIKRFDTLARQLEQHVLQDQPAPIGATVYVLRLARQWCAPCPAHEIESAFMARWCDLAPESATR